MLTLSTVKCHACTWAEQQFKVSAAVEQESTLILDPKTIEAQLRRELNLDFQLFVSEHPIRFDSLTEAERAVFWSFGSARRSTNWLRGRSALKPLLRSMGLDEDTASLSWPQTAFSLAHTDRVAVALGASSTETITGLGIDIECGRDISPRAARFFLHESEWEQLGAEVEAQNLLRLWTVKEALFKADPLNHNRLLTDYVVDDVAASTGRARGPRHETLHYCTIGVEQGWLSAAVCAVRSPTIPL